MSLLIYKFVIVNRKGILLEIVQRSDFGTDKFKETQSKAETAVQNLKPQEEYKELIEKYKLAMFYLLHCSFFYLPLAIDQKTVANFSICFFAPFDVSCYLPRRLDSLSKKIKSKMLYLRHKFNINMKCTK